MELGAAIRNKTDLLLALLFAPDSRGLTAAPVTGITRLEKLLFLLEHEAGFLEGLPDENSFHFVPFRMGPWTQEVYDEIDFLESLGLLEKKERGRRPAADIAHDEELFSSALINKYQRSDSVPEEGQESYSLTEEGRKKARSIWDKLKPEHKQEILRIKGHFNPMNLRQLLRYVYKQYPDYATESEIKDTLGLLHQ